MPEVREEVVNVKLAEILSRDFGLDARPERLRGGRRPDIKCHYRGFTVGIETSYSRADAERDAEERVKQGLADVVVALWLKQRFRDVPEPELEKAIRGSRFGVKVFVPVELGGGLLQHIEKGVGRKAEPATGWLDDVDLPAVKAVIDASIDFLVREEEVRKVMEEAKSKFKDFVEALKSIDRTGAVREKLYSTLYRLYGLSVAETRDPDVVFGHAALSIMLSTVFYEHVRSSHPELESVLEHAGRLGPIEGLKEALRNLLNIDYRAAVELTVEILNALPPNMAYRVKELVELAVKIASNRPLLRRDFAGRLYHEITGDIALRKGFATYYTEVPAAYLLASLAVRSLLNLDERSPATLSHDEARELVKRVESVKVGDLACGSGTLLTASYSVLMHTVSVLKYYHNLEDVDLEAVGRTLVEEGFYGVDALRYASQITAVNLALVAPSTITKENVYTIYLGYMPGNNQAWLGSLELLKNHGRVGGLLAYIEGGLRGAAEKVSLEGAEVGFSVPESFDLVIMNPPFTRPTYRGRREFTEERERSFFGFIADERARRRMSDRYKEVLEEVTSELRSIARDSVGQELKGIPREVEEIVSGGVEEKLRQYLNIGLAGEALPFLYLAYRLVGRDGVVAFVLPRAVLAGVSWFLARVLLASKFHLKYVIVSSDPDSGFNFSEGADLSEALLVARRVDSHDPSEETAFVILTRKPKTALMGMLTASSVVEARRRGEIQFSHEEVEFTVRTVRRESLLKHIDNWNRFVALAEPVLGDYMFKLMDEGLIVVGGYSIRVPLTRLKNVLKTVYVERKRGRRVVKEPAKSIGVDASQFYELFAEASMSPYPALIGTEERFRRAMKVKPNAYIVPRSESVKDRAVSTFRTYAGRILAPGVNIWWDTSHAIVLYSDAEMLSNTHYALKLEVDPPLESYAEKALALWFNTSWGLLTILVNREETRGRWAQVKMGQWMLMPALDITSLDGDTLRRLAEAFDRYAEKPLRRIPEQFNPGSPDPVRLGIDRDFIKALDPSADENTLEKGLIELYRHVDTAFKLWGGSPRASRRLKPQPV